MTRRITVSLPDHLVDAVVAAVREGRASSVSAYVADALAAKSSGETLEQFLSEWRERVGAPRSEEAAWAERALRGSGPAAT